MRKCHLIWEPENRINKVSPGQELIVGRVFNSKYNYPCCICICWYQIGGLLHEVRKKSKQKWCWFVTSSEKRWDVRYCCSDHDNGNITLKRTVYLKTVCVLWKVRIISNIQHNRLQKNSAQIRQKKRVHFWFRSQQHNLFYIS